MRARFATLRDSYQHQLDSLHMQVADIEATSRRPCLPRFADDCAPHAATDAPHGYGLGGYPEERSRWRGASRDAPDPDTTPRTARPRDASTERRNAAADELGGFGHGSSWSRETQVRGWAGADGADCGPRWREANEAAPCGREARPAAPVGPPALLACAASHPGRQSRVVGRVQSLGPSRHKSLHPHSRSCCGTRLRGVVLCAGGQPAVNSCA